MGLTRVWSFDKDGTAGDASFLIRAVLDQA